MSVKLFKANTASHAFTCVLRELSANRDKISRNVVIVPDKFSLSMERNILSRLGIESSFDIEVVSFTRFATKSLKNKIKKCLTPEGSVMLLAYAVSKVADSLKVYDKSAKVRGFANEIYAVLTLLRNSGISASAIQEASMQADEGGVLQGKLHDIALIYQKYVELLEQTHTDSTTRLYAFSDYIPSMPDISNTNIYICDFLEFTAPQYEIIGQFARFSKSLTIGAIVPFGDAKNARLYPSYMLKRLKDLFEKESISVETVEVSQTLSKQNQHILSNFFSYEKQTAKEAENIVLRVAPNADSEINYLAKKIKKLVIDKGARYKDMCVITGDLEGYGDIISKIFYRFDIPCYIDKKQQFKEQAPIRFIISILNMMTQGCSIQAVLELIKNPIFYMNCNYNIIEEFGNFCKRSSIAKVDDSVDFENQFLPILNIINQIKNCIGEGAKTVGEFILGLKCFLEEIEFNKKIELLSDQQKTEFIKVNAQVSEKLKSVFEEMDNTIGDEEVDIYQFLNCLESVFDRLEISIVPVVSDCVYVGSPKDSKYDDFDFMFFVGVAEGSIPSSASETAVLTSRDEELLEELGIDVRPHKKESGKYELLNLIQLFINAKKVLYLSYAERVSGSQRLASILFSQFENLFTFKGKPLKPEAVLEEKYLDLPTLSMQERIELYKWKFATSKAIFYELLANVANESPLPIFMQPYDAAFEILESDYKQKLNRYLISKDNKMILKNKQGLLNGDKFSASRLEKYFSCPYKYFLCYGAKVQRVLEDGLQASDVGTIIHDVLEKFLSGNYENMTLTEIKKFVKKAVEEKIASSDLCKLDWAVYDNSYQTIKKNCVVFCDNIRKQILSSRFKPYILEGKVGKSEEGAQIKGFKTQVFDKEMTFEGYIDRVDMFDRWFTIIDYKSFIKKLDVKSVYKGVNIQPILYMNAIVEDNPSLYPAGLFYLPVKPGYEKKNLNSRFRMSGFVLKDSEVVKTLDCSVGAEEKSEFYPFKFKKDNTLYSTGNLISDTEFTAMSRYVKTLSKTALEEMADGNIEASPVESACEFCDYNAICEFAFREDFFRTSFPSISAANFDDINNGKAWNCDCELEEADNDD